MVRTKYQVKISKLVKRVRKLSEKVEVVTNERDDALDELYDYLSSDEWRECG